MAGANGSGRVVLVTGGMGGLGETICTKMADAGYRVVVTYSPGNTDARRVARRHEGAGLRASRAYACDVTDFDSCAACVAEGRTRRSAPVDILVNNAGITRDMTFKKMDKVDWDAVMQDQPRQRLQHDQAGRRRHGRARLGPHHQRLVGQRPEGRVRPDQLLGGQGRHARLHQGAGARSRASKGVTVNTISPGYIGTKMVTAIPKEVLDSQDPAADSDRPARQARGSRRPDHLPGVRRSRVRHRRQHRDQRRPAHAVTAARPRHPRRTG